MTRRTALWTGAAAAALALGGAGLFRALTSSGSGRPLRGAGWKVPFFTDEGQAQHWWADSGVSFDKTFTAVSGTSCLTLDEATLRGLDFMTCPDKITTKAMLQRLQTVLGRAPLRTLDLCTGSCVAVIRWEMLTALVNAGVLVRPSGVDTGARLDLNRYLKVCTDQWGEYDRYLTLDQNHAISLDIADPLTDSSGRALLAALDDARADKEHPEDSGFPTTRSLWRPGTSATGKNPAGPLTRKPAADESKLVAELLDGDRHMIYVDEQMALRTVLGRKQTDFVVLRTLPEVTFTHSLLILTKEAELLGERITGPKITRALGENGVRAKGQEASVSGRVRSLTQNWDSALTEAQEVMWKDRTLSLDDRDLTSLMDAYRTGTS